MPKALTIAIPDPINPKIAKIWVKKINKTYQFVFLKVQAILLYKSYSIPITYADYLQNPSILIVISAFIVNTINNAYKCKFVMKTNPIDLTHMNKVNAIENTKFEVLIIARNIDLILIIWKKNKAPKLIQNN